jgi:hypothetical protein
MSNVAERSRDGNHADLVVDLEAVATPELLHQDQGATAHLPVPEGSVVGSVADSKVAVAVEASEAAAAVVDSRTEEVTVAEEVLATRAVGDSVAREVVVVVVDMAVTVTATVEAMADRMVTQLLQMHQLDQADAVVGMAATVGAVMVAPARPTAMAPPLGPPWEVGMSHVAVAHMMTDLVATVAAAVEATAIVILAVEAAATWSR